MDEDWLAGIEDGSTQTAAPAVVSGSQSGSWFDTLSANSRAI
jgi:hypothetical protein